MVKHWMDKHPEQNILPTFTFTILRSFKDSLSRQVSEAVTMFLSKDNLLNSKNEYVQNCISRVTIEEDKYQRKLRERLEEKEESDEADRLEAFKKEKLNRLHPIPRNIKDGPQPGEGIKSNLWSKRRGENIPEGWRQRQHKKRRTENTTSSAEHIIEDLIDWWKWVTEDCLRAGRVGLLKERMKTEREFIINWMNNKSVVKTKSDRPNKAPKTLPLQMSNLSATTPEMQPPWHHVESPPSTNTTMSKSRMS